MSDAVRDAIAAYLSDLARFQAPPEEPYGYGSDVSCAFDLDRNVREISGDNRLVLAQAIVRRLDTPRGSLPDDPNYGIALRAMLNSGLTSAQIRSISGRIYNEVSKDDRIDALTVRVDPGVAGESLTISLDVVPVDAGETFSMVLAVTSGEILLEAIS